VEDEVVLEALALEVVVVVDFAEVALVVSPDVES
jgi:hypothetical protein